MAKLRVLSVGCLLLLTSSSCSIQSRGVRPPGIDPAGAAKAAMSQFDGNSDGKLDEAELEISALSLELWDTDGDGGVTASEITERLGKFVDSGVGIANVACSVSWNRSPLENATVTFEPAAFLGDGMEPSTGTTDGGGIAEMSIADELLPHPNMKGIQPGVYRVRITHPEVNLPEKYNTNSTLTYEYSPLETLPPPNFRLSK